MRGRSTCRRRVREMCFHCRAGSRSAAYTKSGAFRRTSGRHSGHNADLARGIRPTKTPLPRFRRARIGTGTARFNKVLLGAIEPSWPDTARVDCNAQVKVGCIFRDIGVIYEGKGRKLSIVMGV